MQDDDMDLLRAAPGAGIVFAALEGEPGVHVVGGAVRDALLGRRPRELDLVVEGDAIAVARRAAERVGGTLTVHERFGTATIHADRFAFDLATARRERYARPGALPEVELGATLREDLARRDFTVNAMAVRLDDGALTTWAGARADLDAGILRVLHEASFIDDPTRMLRLVRYAARLDFRPDPHTDALIDPSRFETVSGDRLGNELRLLVREPQPEALRELLWHGMGQELLGDGFHVSELVARTGPGLLALAACCTQIPPDELSARLDHLGFNGRERDIVVAAASGYERLRETLARDDIPDSELWHLFRRERAGTAELLAAGGAPGARRWLDDVRHRRLAITGDDLVAAGLSGAAVGDGLARATMAMLDGAAPDRGSQLAAALA
jgi:tRNA nucleotidyltransferase (CCA-adding enzyme)